MAFENILVVCVGNICRSPMAQALLELQYPRKIIDSAGVCALVGSPADPSAVKVMANHNIDIKSHVAKQVTAEQTRYADLILTMSTNQTKWIENHWSYCRGKTFRLGHWIDKDIADPYRHEFADFETAYQDIKASLKDWQDKIS